MDKDSTAADNVVEIEQINKDLKSQSINNKDVEKVDQDKNKAEAEKFREKGNEEFRTQHYSQAIQFYSSAIELVPNEASYYGNRSFAYLKSEFYGYALQDATKSVELDPKYVKGYYRRASANLALGKFKLAVRDYEFVTKMCPNDKDAMTKYNECQKIIKKLAFERAIAASDEDKKNSVFDQFDINSIEVESSYKGPSFSFNDTSCNITHEFVTSLLNNYKEQKVLHRKYALKILIEIYRYFKSQPSLIDIKVNEDERFTVCGQFYDLINIFKINGMPSQDNPYLFNGDFVDRGSFSVEVIFTLFSLKLLYPNHFFLARGNHESVNMNQMYGFEGEVKAKYSPQMFQLFSEIFNYLPLSHCIAGKILVMHGGLFSKDNVTLDDIRKIERNRQPPEDGLMCELMWSDPQYPNGRSESKRGVGVQFGPDVTKRFLETNKLEFIIRSHEVKAEGYEVMHDGKCITVFSAPNYCDTMGNKGAFIKLNGKTMKPEFVSYEAVEHPVIKPMAYATPFSFFGLS